MTDKYAAFKKKLVAAGGEVLGTTNPYEVMRFRSKYGVGVVWQNSRGKETWSREAILARDHLSSGLMGSLLSKKTRRKGKAGEVEALMARDGDECFFCLLPLGDDVTKEHLVPTAHNGPNHMSNKFLAHGPCNVRAGHLSAPEKIRIREAALRQRWENENIEAVLAANKMETL